MMVCNYSVFSSLKTRALGKKIAIACAQMASQRPLIIFLRGDLGAGKTTLVRGFLHGLGFLGKVKSPTFTLVEPYKIESITIYHFDLYRLRDPQELEYIGASDYFAENAISLIEWPEKAESLLPRADLEIALGFDTENAYYRKIIVSAGSDIGKEIIGSL